jgi:hypothetical protein
VSALLAAPASLRAVRLDEVAEGSVADGELLLVEAGLPGAAELAARVPERVVEIETAFPATAAELLGRAIEAASRDDAGARRA